MAARFYLVDLESGIVTRTDDKEVAEKYALWDMAIVIDSEADQILAEDGGRQEIPDDAPPEDID